MSQELFKSTPNKVKDLLGDIRRGRLGLPDLQRPFVWTDVKVRNLFDSMMRGYPIGYVMIWAAAAQDENKVSQIGTEGKSHSEPNDLIIDGQQRLTALVASMYGVKVKDKDYAEREIKISYNPLTKEFAVWTIALEKNPEWIAKISDIYLAKENNTFYKEKKKYLRTLNDARIKKGLAELTDEDEEQIEDSLNDLLGLEDFPIPTLLIPGTTDEESVAEIFVRVNSGGQNLNENNFIQTLLAVYQKDAYDKITRFCEDSRIPKNNTSYNHLIEVEPQHIIRMTVGLGFQRAKMRYAYMLLRGKDLGTGLVSTATREANLKIFSDALDEVLNLNNWHAYLNCVSNAGFVSDKMISAAAVVTFSYVLYLLGKIKYKVPTCELNKIIGKWFFMANTTSLYSSSTETEAERQFADLRDISTADEFIEHLETEINSRFTDDYFNITLPIEFTKQAIVSPVWNSYTAAQIILNYPLLFSTSSYLNQLLAPGVSGTKNAIDKHHIFPKNYLTRLGYISDRERNQIANFTYLDYPTNIRISDNAPSLYVKDFKNELGADYVVHLERHALPTDFENMDYKEFLQKRRLLMSQIIKKAYQKL